MFGDLSWFSLVFDTFKIRFKFDLDFTVQWLNKLAMVIMLIAGR